jgi:cell division protein FtsA
MDMKLPFLSDRPEKPTFDEGPMIAVDIGTEILKTLLFRCDAVGVHILDSSRIFQQQHAMRSGVIRSLETVIENCRLGMNDVTKGLEPEEMPKNIMMGIAGELIHGVSVEVNYDREDNAAKEVDEKEQENILTKVKENIHENGKMELANRYGMDPEDIEVLHITITGIEIGGMSVESLKGFTGKRVRLNFYASFAPRTYLEALKKVAESMELELAGIVSQPFAMARVVSGASEKNFNGIFIDVGGGTTDIALVQKGNVSDTQIFSFGGRVFTKRIGRKMNLDYRHAEARKIKYAEGGLDSKIAMEVRRAIRDDLSVWVEGLEVALGSMEDVEQFPPFMYLCGGGALLPDLRKALIEYPWTKKLPFPRYPKVLLVTPEKLDMVHDKHQHLKDAMDITPAGLARFAWDQRKYPDRHFVN